MTEMNVQPQSTEKTPLSVYQGINPLDLVKYLLSNWYWFVLSLAVFVSVASYVYSTTQKMYSCKASVIFKDTQTFAEEARLDRLTGYYYSNKNVTNDILLLRSNKLMQDVVRNLGAEVSYVVMDGLREQELYSQAPFRVVFDSLEVGRNFSLTVTPLEKDRVELSDFSIPDEDKVVTLGDTVKVGDCIFVVTPTLYWGDSWIGRQVSVHRRPLVEVAGELTSRLNVNIAGEEDVSSILTMSLTDFNPLRAEDVLNTLIMLFNEQNILEKNQASINTTNFINERLQIIEQELGGVEQEIEAYQISKNMIDISSEASISQNERQQYNSLTRDLQREAQIGQYIHDYLTNPANANELIPSQTVNDVSIENQIKQYNSTKLKRDKLMQESSEHNPVIQDLNNTLSSMRQSIIRSVNNMNVSTEVKLRDAQNRASQAASRIGNIPIQQRELQSIQRQQRIKEELYLYLLNRREENALLQATTESDARILEPPYSEDKPVSPSHHQMMLQGIAGGLALPALVLLFILFSDTKVRSRRDIEHVVNVPFLGEVPKTSAHLRHSFKNSIVVSANSRDAVSESFRIIRTNMDFMQVRTKELKVVTFSSFGSGSGKTYVSSNLAACFAMSGKRVVLIDLDIRKGTLTNRSSHSKSKGMTTYLLGQAELEDVLKCNELGENLDFIPSGSVAPNPADLLMSDRMDKLISELRNRYDLIIIDNVPYGVVADSVITNRLADLTVFVIRAGKIDKRLLPEIEYIYRSGKLKNLSLVLNDAIIQNNSYGYRYGYGYGYGYGYRYGYGYGYGGKHSKPWWKKVLESIKSNKA